MTDTSIRTAVAAWLSDATAAETTYGHISTWETGGVTDMSELFCESSHSLSTCYNSGAASFNEDISAWDTSGVKTMYGMFNGASSFNRDIGGWAVDSVTHMGMMFAVALVFDQDIANWAVHSVKNMKLMFDRASSFNQDIGGWAVHSVTDMSGMFEEAWAFNQEIGDWAVHNVKYMSQMFADATSFNQDLGWCVDDDVEFDPDGDGSLTFQDAFESTPCASTSCGVLQGDACAPTPLPVPNPTPRPVQLTTYVMTDSNIRTAVAAWLADASAAETTYAG